jgi:2-amino-4-hydroxy-6-hydroxymethyldihydropteridine diphosphokinase
MNKAYLLIGGNLGDRMQNLETARQLIGEHCGTITNTSSIYETEAWGNSDQPSFLNQAVELETKYNAKQLIRRILKTEKNMGRVRKEKYGPRLIDIDILLFNDEQHNYTFLNIPHPELHNRRFALIPLAEIAPDAVHNVFKKTINELLEECKDDLSVRKIKL